MNLKESKINEVLESLRSSKEIGQSLEAELVITCSNEDDLFEILDRRQDQLAELFIVSSVIVKPREANSELTISAHHAPGVRCPRSWRWVPELVEVDGWGQVSPRCAQVLNKI